MPSVHLCEQCAAVMSQKADEVAKALYRVLKICDDSDAVCDTASTLEHLCEGANRCVLICAELRR